MLDMCRDSLCTDSSRPAQFSDPERHAAPEFWSLCLSCSRGALTNDGDVKSHSLFIQEFLNPTRGMFASSVLIKRGIESACNAMEITNQRPVTIRLDHLPPGFCLDESPKNFDLIDSVGQRGATGTVTSIGVGDGPEHEKRKSDSAPFASTTSQTSKRPQRLWQQGEAIYARQIQ